MSTTLTRSPALCIDAVLRNLEWSAQFEEHTIRRLTEQRDRADVNVSAVSVYDAAIYERQLVLKSIRDHQQLIRTECAEFIGLHDKNLTAAGDA